MIFAPETKKFDFEVQYSTFVEKENIRQETNVI
jgi:hypothetical protein